MQTKLFLALAAISLWSGTILISAGSDIYGQTTAGNEPGSEPGAEPGVETSSNVSSSYSK
jgi:hypothetical protein